MEFSDYNLMFIHIKGGNILADVISRLKKPDIYRDPLDYSKTSDTMTCVADMVTIDIQTLNIDKLHTKQKDIHCRNLAAQSIIRTRVPSTLSRLPLMVFYKNNNMYMD